MRLRKRILDNETRMKQVKASKKVREGV